MTSVAFLTNLAGPQGLIILLLVIFFFGARRLPEVGRGLGEALREFSKGREGKDEEKDKKNLV